MLKSYRSLIIISDLFIYILICDFVKHRTGTRALLGCRGIVANDKLEYLNFTFKIFERALKFLDFLKSWAQLCTNEGCTKNRNRNTKL